MNIFNKIKQDLYNEFDNINYILQENLKMPEELVNIISSYVMKRAGKKIRPLMTILATKMFQNEINNESIYLAAAVELIHLATILHDDVIDKADLRNGIDTPNKIWDNKISILSGDFLFSAAFKLMVKSQNLDALKLLSDSAEIITRGEIIQHDLHKKSKMISQQDYIEVIEKKTAQLFAASTACGAIAASQDYDTVKKIENFGFLFGKIFQISDDRLDYFGNTDNTGKNIGQDFYESKITLPVILAYQKSKNHNHAFWANDFFKTNKKDSDFQNCLNIMLEYKIDQEIQVICNSLCDRAKETLNLFQITNQYSKALLDLLASISNREL